MRGYATADIDDLEECDTMILFCDNDVASKGKWFEWGYMMGRRAHTVGHEIALVGVGKQEHVFEFMADHWFKDVADLLDWTNSI